MTPRPRASTDYVVEPYYVHPADQPYVREYEEAARRACEEIREWYRRQVGTTFRMAPLRAVRAARTYDEMRFGDAPPPPDGSWPAWVESVLEAVGGWEDRRVKWVFAQGGGGVAVGNLQDDHRGFGIFGDWVLEPISGVTNEAGVPAREATWQVQGGVPMGTTVHELGHAFGVHHPEPDVAGKTLMRWHGDYPDVGFLPHEIAILRASPFFEGVAPPDPGAPIPSFATADRALRGEELVILGRRLGPDCVVEMVDVVDGAERATGLRVVGAAATELRVVVPEGTGPGYLRIRRGPLASPPLPLN